MKKWLFSCLFIIIITGLRAQSLGFASYATPGLADTVLKSSTITYGVTVKSTGLLPVTGNYSVYVGVLDTSGSNVIYVDSVLVTSNSFQPGDSSQVTITHIVDPIKFMDGGNTVVIWPAAPGVLTTDTIFKDVFVIDFQSVADYENKDVILYPNPASEYLMIQSKEIIENVRIWNLSGQLIYTGKSHFISLQSWSKGSYFIEIESASGKLIRRKIIIEK